MTVSELLTTMSPYPVPEARILAIGDEVGADMSAETSAVSAVTLNRVKARLYLFLATIPNVSEGGVSISFTATEKNLFLSLARRYAALAGEPDLVPGAVFGYKGENV